MRTWTAATSSSPASLTAILPITRRYVCSHHQDKETFSMFIAMNRFRVAKGSEAAFEHIWITRSSKVSKFARQWDAPRLPDMSNAVDRKNGLGSAGAR